MTKKVDGLVNDDSIDLLRSFGDEILLDTFSVIGQYRRFEEAHRVQLQDWWDSVYAALASASNRRQNFLVWGFPGEGKTRLVTDVMEALSARLSDFRPKRCNLAQAGESDFEGLRAELLKAESSPTLCFFDEVDDPAASSYYGRMLELLELNEKPGHVVCFVLAASGFGGLENMLAELKSRPKGTDLVSRIPSESRLTVPKMTLGDRVLVAVDTATRAKPGEPLVAIERFALYYLLCGRQLESPRDLTSFVQAAIGRMRPIESRLRYAHLFDPAAEAEQFSFRLERQQAAAELSGFVALPVARPALPEPPSATGRQRRADGARPAEPTARASPHEQATETLTFLFTDIEGSTALLRRLGDATYTEVLAHHHSIIRSGLAAHDGREVDTQGDAFFAVFSSPRACMAAVIEIQRTLASHEWPAEELVQVRMGVHSGEASETSTGLVGFEVHRAARIAAVAHGGQIVLSATAAALVRESLPVGAFLRDLGLHRLKDLGASEQIFQLQADGLEVDFPPLRSLDNPELPNNLPGYLSVFIGREAELAEVRSLVESYRLVTLTGAGGSGKTRLALQVAAELLDGSGEGVWFVDLAPIAETEQVPGAVAAALSIREQPGRAPLETLLEVLREQRVLIVLDNCEHVVDACAKLADLIERGCPRVHLMATSREPLGIDGEHVYRVRSLSLPSEEAITAEDLEGSDAVELFVERARSHDDTFVLDDSIAGLVASICRRLDGIPFAIELAAARLTSMPLVDLNGRLDHRFRLLTGGTRTALPRQRTLQATVDWSFDLLNNQEKEVLRRLSVFVGGFELEAAESVCTTETIGAFEIADLVASLVNKSLVVAERSSGSLRYRLLETIRQYAAEKLIDADGVVERTRDAHAAYYLTYAEQAAPHLSGRSQDAWLARLEEEYPNLRVAAEHLLDTGKSPQALRLFGVARRYWRSYRHADAAALLDRALELAGREAPPADRAAALACSATTSSNLVEMAARARDAVDAAREAGDRRLEAEALGLSCTVAYFRGVPAEGLESGVQALAIARELGDPVLLGFTLAANFGAVQVNDTKAGEALVQEGLSVVERSGDLTVARALHSDYGCYLLREGRVSEARRQLESALGLTPTRHGAPTILGNLGLVLLAEGDVAGATSNFTEALRSTRLSGDVGTLAYSTLGLALCATRSGDVDRAAIMHGGAAALLEADGATTWEDPEKEFRDRDIATLRASVGSEFELLYELGRAMSHTEIVDFALGR